MGLLDWLRGPSEEQIAEAYLREGCDENYTPGSIRHYIVEEVTDDIERQTGIALRDDQTVRIVQRIRDDYGYGPIAESNLPGYANPDDYPDYPEEYAELVAHNAERAERNAQIAAEQEQSSGGGFLGWLLGR
jgi:hypothetical protein